MRPEKAPPSLASQARVSLDPSASPGDRGLRPRLPAMPSRSERPPPTPAELQQKRPGRERLAQGLG